MATPRELDLVDILLLFANDSLKGETLDGRAKIVGRGLFVEGKLLAIRSRAENFYVNDDHPNTPARKILRHFLPASEAIHANNALIKELAISLKVLDKNGVPVVEST